MEETKEDCSREASDAQLVMLSLSCNILLIKCAFNRPDLKDKEGWAPSVIHVPLSNAGKNCKPSVHQRIPEILHCTVPLHGIPSPNGILLYTTSLSSPQPITGIHFFPLSQSQTGEF